MLPVRVPISLLRSYNATLSSYVIKRGILSSPRPDISIPDVNYVDFLLQKADKYANHVAIINALDGQKYTFCQLIEAKRNVCSGLTKVGAKQGTITALITPNCPEFVFAECGVLASGGTLTTTNPIYTEDEMIKQWTDIYPEYIIAHKAMIEPVKRAAAALKCVKEIFVIGGTSHGCRSFDELLNDKGDADSSGSWTGNWKEDVAIMPYSSGTTGLPKGVMITHSNLVANTLQLWAVMEKIREGNEVFLGLLPFFHIYGLALILGLSVHTKSALLTVPRFDPESFFKMMDTYKVTQVPLVPPVLHFMNAFPHMSQFDLSNIRQVTSGAAPFDAASESGLRKKIQSLAPESDVFQGYGLTESTIVHLPPIQEKRVSGKDGSVGQLMPNMKAKIVCVETSKELSSGETGEIYLQGPNIMKGYFNRPLENQEAFIDGWYRTGDLGYHDKDGYFYIVDRLKELIKYKAQQVAPAELEGILREHPAVIDTAVVGKPDSMCGELPTAFVVLKGTASEKEILDFVASKVSDFKHLRGGVYIVDQIPKTLSGKILRRELKQRLCS